MIELFIGKGVKIVVSHPMDVLTKSDARERLNLGSTLVHLLA